MASLDTLQSKKDVQECMREVQRIFKSIVKESGNVIDNSSDHSPAKLGDQEQEHIKILDDLHVIICMNKLLQCEVSSPDGQKQLPVLNYNKLHKLLRNLIIFSSQTIEQIQIEVFVQNSDTFIDIINNCLKYIGQESSQKKVVPYDLIDLIVDLILKITKKSKEMRFEVDIPQFLNIFNQVLEIM